MLTQAAELFLQI